MPEPALNRAASSQAASSQAASSQAGASLARGPAACPGLFRIVAARDGGICRVRIALGRLSASQARVIAGAAARFGNGTIEATNRANIQIRGVAAGDEAALVAALIDGGLGPARPEADDIRNVMVSPTAGIDAGQEMDALPLARDLLVYLQADETCRALSPKFSFLVDGGEAVAMVDHPHDVWLAALAGGEGMALGFAGCPPVRADDETPFAILRPAHALEAIAAALALFSEMATRDPAITRFRHLFAHQSREAFFDRLARKLGSIAQAGTEAKIWRRQAPLGFGHVGIGDQRQEDLAFVGAVPPLGRLAPAMVTGLADIAETFGDGTFRLTPWQSVVVPNIRRGRAGDARRALEGLGLVCDPGDPLACLVACAGTPGCNAALADTKADGLALARKLAIAGQAPRSIHLSACAKSCASARVADATLVASASGRYELFLKSPGRGGKFGESTARDLTVDQAGARLSRIFSAPPPDEIEGRE